MSNFKKPLIGILAIQGAVEEHANHLLQLGANVREIRLPEDFIDLDGIILPGGESTTMAIVGEEYGIFPKLQSWVQAEKPVSLFFKVKHDLFIKIYD